MSGALEAFRAQRQAADDIHVRLQEVASLIQSLLEQVCALAHDEQLRQVLQTEQSWLVEARQTVREVRRLREEEVRRFWPAVWRRWALAMVFALASAAAFGAGSAWSGQPYEAELASLRARVELLDYVAHRLIKMSPAERRQFDRLMGWNKPSH